MKSTLAILVILAAVSTGSCLRITTFPNIVIEAVHPELTISCHENNSTYKDASSPYRLSIVRGIQESVVSIDDKSNIGYGTYAAASGRYKADGEFGSNKGKDYLSLTISKPRKSDEGVYTCLMYYENTNMMVVEVRTSKKIRITDYRSLINRVSTLETIASKVNKDINEWDNSTVVQDQEIESLDKMASNQADELENVENVVFNHSGVLTQLETISSTQSKEIDILESRLARHDTKLASLETISVKHSGSIDRIENLTSEQSQMIRQLSGLSANQSEQSDRLETIATSRQQEIDSLKTLTTHQGNRIDNLKTVAEKQSEKFDNLEKQLGNHVRDFNTEKKSTAKLFTNLDTVIAGLKARLTSVEKENNEQKKKLDELDQMVYIDVKFSAETGHVYLFANNLKQVLWSKVLYSSKVSGYDRKTSTFTAPVAGLYKFDLEFVKYIDDELTVALEVNGKSLIHLVASDKGKTMTAMTNLDKGDKVNAHFKTYFTINGGAILAETSKIFYSKLNGQLIRPVK